MQQQHSSCSLASSVAHTMGPTLLRLFYSWCTDDFITSSCGCCLAQNTVLTDCIPQYLSLFYPDAMWKTVTKLFHGVLYTSKRLPLKSSHNSQGTLCSLLLICLLVVLGPRVLLQETVNHLLHCKVWDELVLGQVSPRHWVKVTNSLITTINTNTIISCL